MASYRLFDPHCLDRATVNRLNRRAAALRGLLLAAWALPVAAQQASPGPWLLLTPGQFHAGEAPAQADGAYLALRLDGEPRLEPGQYRSEAVYDSVLDAEGQATGVQLSLVPEAAVLLLAGEQLRAGALTAAELTADHEQQPLPAFRFAGVDYRFEVNPPELWLRRADGVASVLAELSVSGPDGEDSASLRWAGDLDRDGRPDLIVDYSGYNRSGVCVYLSSLAADSALLAAYACHGGVGC